MVRYTSVIFSQEDAMNFFSVDVFNPGNDEKKSTYPYRDSICFKGKDGTGKPFPFRTPFDWWSKHNNSMVKSGNSENRKLCLTQNHAISGMELDGCQYITIHLELKNDEV